jgi:hypothetical protein
LSDDNTDSPNGQLSPEHAAFLEAQAVDLELARSLGVRSLLSRDDNPQEGVWVNWANHPAILFPWVSPDGHREYQVRPDDPTQDTKGKLRKYVFAAGAGTMLWAIREVRKPKTMLIVEGTKQALAAASYAGPDVSVYGIAGCRAWQKNNVAIPDLAVADGHDVVILLDADAATNRDVYDAGTQMAAALVGEGAEKVLFGRLPSAGTSGLDDILGGRAPDRRAAYLARLIRDAKPKPADKAPVRKKKPGPGGPTAEGDRPVIVCNRDRYSVINDLTEALLNRWNARVLFNHGGVISRRKSDVMSPVDSGAFVDLIQETAQTVNENENAQGTTHSYCWPDANSIKATLSRAEKFAPLDRVSHAPFVRPDGTVVTSPGYDEATRTLLVLDPVFDGIEVPETPTGEEVSAARKLLLDEWLGDFPFDSDADQANVLAMVVTPAIRGLCPKVPLAVIDGLQMGVGKNLLADSLLTVYTGEAARPMNWVSEPEELRKQITSAFRTGAEFFVFDEAHTVEGTALAQALTAETWQDRILGVSTMADFPNRVTWMSLGNQVQVKGDLARRVYRIALRPRYANPQDRKASTFRHPELVNWTRAHRRELMVAILTLVRAWFAAGSPVPKRGVSFGSFEVWERITGGIVETAGLEDFLGNLKIWRSESDFDTQYWEQHLKWLRELFGTKPFRTAQVKEKALQDPADYSAPPRLDDPSDKAFGKALGEAYSRMRERRIGGMWLQRVSAAHGNVSQWTVHDESDLPPAPGTEPDPEPDIPEPDPAPYNEHAEARGADESDLTGGETDSEVSEEETAQPVDNSGDKPEVVTFDLETGDAEDLYRAPGDEYVRIGATAADGQEVQSWVPGSGSGPKSRAMIADVVGRVIRDAGVITGHNIMAFDLPALARAGAVTMPEIHRMAAAGQLADGLIMGRYLDPPMARDKGVDVKRKYDLGTLGIKYGLGEKLTDVSKPLAAKYGGWGHIPIDIHDPDPERAADSTAFIGYMEQDVELSRALYTRLSAEVAERGPVAEAYLKREHRVAAIAAQISFNGFRVDVPELTKRAADIDRQKTRVLGWLNARYGIPLADARGKPYASPLASKAGQEALEAALTAAGATSLWRTAKSQALDTSGEHMLHLARENAHLPEVRKIAKAVAMIVGARSVFQTALDNLMPDGRVHPKVSFEQATGRWSVTRPGLTVFGKRGGRHVERDVFLADEGEVLAAFDLSQVDMRAVAGLSGDQAYIEMLKREDPHAELAFALFGDRSLREKAKAIGHGWNYGESLRRISESNDIEPRIVKQFDTSMYERFGRLVEWREEIRALAESGALLDNGFGRLMRPDPQRAHTQGPALMGQGAARDLMMEGMLRLPADILPMLRAQIHDEIVLSIPQDRVEEVSRTVIDALSFEWRGVPILADVSRTATSWGQCYVKG